MVILRGEKNPCWSDQKDERAEERKEDNDDKEEEEEEEEDREQFVCLAVLQCIRLQQIKILNNKIIKYEWKSAQSNKDSSDSDSVYKKKKNFLKCLEWSGKLHKMNKQNKE